MTTKHNLLHKAALAAVLVLVAGTAFAARPRHYLSAWGELGYSNFLHKFTDTKALGNGGIGFGGGYELRKDAFLFHTGIEFTALNSSNKLKNLDFDLDMQDTEDDHLIWHGKYIRYKETQHAGNIEIPVLFGGQWKPWYFLVGAKAGVNLYGTYCTHGKLNTTGTYDRYIDDFVNMPPHYFTDTKWRQGNQSIAGDLTGMGYSGARSFALLNVAASAEVGMYLDKYINKARKKRANAASADEANANTAKGKQPATKKNAVVTAEPAVTDPAAGARVDKFKREPMHLRVAVFADYGVLNMQNPTMVGFSDETIETMRRPDYVSIPEPEIIDISSHSVNVSNRAHGAINPLFVGVKATLTFDVTRPPKKKPVPVKPIPNPKPKPVPPVPVLEGKVTDAETGEAIYDPKVEIFDLTGTRRYGSQPAEGDFSTKLDRSKTYRVVVTAPGYYTRIDTVSDVKEAVKLPLQPIKPEPIVMENVFFEFDKTDILPASDVELDKWAQFLKDNPALIIHITGHTDYKGSDAYNQRLSEGRAQAVMEALIQRGIDPVRLSSSGKGESQPRDTNETDEGRARNRRVEFEVVGILDLNEE